MTWIQQNSKRADLVLPTVTDAAAKQVRDLLEGRNIPEDVAVRVHLVDGAPVFEVGQKRADDMMFVYEGRVILLLDARTALSMAGYTFDSHQTPEGPQFVLRSPEEL